MKVEPMGMSTMPCAHLVDKFKVSYHTQTYATKTVKKDVAGRNVVYSFKGYFPDGTANVYINNELEDYQVGLWKKREPNKVHDYMYFETRFILTSRASVEADRLLKLAKWAVYEDALARLLPHVSSLPYECAQYWVEEAFNHMSFGDHTYEFVKTHPNSKPCPNGTWTQVQEWGKLGILYNFTHEFTESWVENFREQGKWCLDWATINVGNRGRSPGVPFINWLKWLLLRCRQIGYVTGPSSLNAFIEHEVKVAILKNIFKRFEEVIGCPILCPKIHGGSIYTKLRESYLDGKILAHYDVNGMEMITPSILQGRMNNFDRGIGTVIGYMGTIPELLSGVSPTSDWDMIAHLELFRILMEKSPIRPLYVVILGDDMTVVWDDDWKIVSPLYDRQHLDDRLVRTLGLVTAEWMHPVGRHITIDRADKRLNLEHWWDRWIENRHDYQYRHDIAEFFAGSIREKPIHEILAKAPPIPNVYSPKEMVLHQVGLAEA
jgi:hypothetical protein